MRPRHGLPGHRYRVPVPSLCERVVRAGLRSGGRCTAANAEGLSQDDLRRKGNRLPSRGRHGCCEIPVPGTSTTATVFLESGHVQGPHLCDMASLTDPTKCAPCTQVPSCLNPCDACELCVGKTELPASCADQTCPAGVQKCGLVGQAPCLQGQSCIMGCCRSDPL